MNTKEQLITLACELFAQHGYDAVGVQQIVDKVGVTKPTLYHHFGSKEGLLSAVLEYYLKPHLQQLRKQANYQGDLYLTLKQSLMTTVQFAQEQPAASTLFRFMGQMPVATVSAQAIRPYLKQQHAIYEALFSSASIDHGNMQGRASLYAMNFLSTSLTYAAAVALGDTVMGDELQHLVIHSFLHGVFS